jgi:hypothetical protein
MRRFSSSRFSVIAIACIVPMVALAQVSNNYNEPIDTMNSGGGEGAKSNNYQLNDTIGESITGESTTSNYTLQSGYRNSTTDPSIAVSCGSTLDLGTVTIGSSVMGEATCTIQTDSDVGYTLHWRIPSGSGGTNTGSLISQFNTIIPPLSPSVPSTPETFTSVSSSDARFAGRISSASTDTMEEWGIDGMTEKWLNIHPDGRSIVTRTSQTEGAGSVQKMQVKVIVGSTNNTTAGLYHTVVLLTAYAN